jgi:hypothetical protein
VTLGVSLRFQVPRGIELPFALFVVEIDGWVAVTDSLELIGCRGRWAVTPRDDP